MARSTHRTRSERTYGIEIEGYNVPRARLVEALTLAGLACVDAGYTHTTTPYWKVVSDGSVQGNDSFELVSPILHGASGLAQIAVVCDILNRLGAKVNKSCGLHVHHDANDLTLKQWKHLVKYWLKYEGAFDSIMPQSRRLNNNGRDHTNYCQSVKLRFLNIAAAFKAIDTAKTLEGLAEIVCSRDRYHKLNMEAFWRHGTVEFRHHSGTVEYEKIAAWICLTNGLIEKAVGAQRMTKVEGDLKSLLRVTKMSAHTTRFYTTRATALALAA